MLYYKCPTCKKVLAHVQIPYEQRLESIVMDNKLTYDQKEESKRKLLDDLDVKRICCRGRVLGYVRLIDLIN